MKVILIILAIIVLLIAIVLIKAITLKPTAAKTAKVPVDNTERAVKYGKQLAQMVQKETVSFRDQEDRTKFYEFHEILEELFPNVHAVCEKHVFNGSLLFKWAAEEGSDVSGADGTGDAAGAGKSEPILLMSHQDVVEANGTWQHDPFSGHIDENGKVWGRGTVDTKASLFCIFTALEELIAEGIKPSCDVYIASSCTEEWSGEGAPMTVQYLQDNGIKLGLVVDEGGMIIEEPIGGVFGTYGMIGIVEKGYGDVKFKAKGSGGNASAPGKNTPLVRLGKFMAAIDKKSPFRTEMSPVMVEMFRRLAPNMNFGMKLLFANMWRFKGLIMKVVPMVSAAAGAMMKTTIAFTMAEGADGANVLPQEASVVANMRFIQHQPTQESIDIITREAAKFDLETEVIYSEDPAPIIDFKGKQFKMIEDVIHDVYPGIGACPYIMTGGTDAKFYSPVCDNCIRFAPLYIDGQQYESIHGLDENIYQGTLPMGVDFYKEVIKRS